jgi:hypothetical protein
MPRVASKFTVRNACSGRPAITARCARAVVGVSHFQRAALLCSSAAVSMGASRTSASCATAGRKVAAIALVLDAPISHSHAFQITRLHAGNPHTYVTVNAATADKVRWPSGRMRPPRTHPAGALWLQRSRTLIRCFRCGRSIGSYHQPQSLAGPGLHAWWIDRVLPRGLPEARDAD